MKKRFIYPWVLLTIVVAGIGYLLWTRNEQQTKIQDQEYLNRAEKEFYEKCVTVSDYRSYIKKYPEGLYIELCQNRINEFVADSIAQEEYEQQIAQTKANEIAKNEEYKKNQANEKAKREKEKQYRLEYPEIGDLKIFDDGTKGIVYYVDNTGKHGLVVSLDEFKGKWGNYIKLIDGLDKGDETFVIGLGLQNTQIIIDKLGGTADAANWCRLKGKDWYLPSYAEMKQLLAYANLAKGNSGPISNAIYRHGGESISMNEGYWVSSYYRESYAFICMPNGSLDHRYTSSHHYVRAVRMF